MQLESLTLKAIEARPVVLKLKRPVVARIATITDWPLILIDLHTGEGVVGRAYLEPYIPKSMAYLVPALHDLGEMLKGRRVAPVEFYELGRKSLHFVGYEGLSMIAVAGLDMAAWDALARAAGVPLCVLLGGTVGPVKAYNSNGLWLQPPAQVAAEALELRDEGGFGGLKLRMGRARLADDLLVIVHTVRHGGPTLHQDTEVDDLAVSPQRGVQGHRAYRVTGVRIVQRLPGVRIEKLHGSVRMTDDVTRLVEPPGIGPRRVHAVLATVRPAERTEILDAIGRGPGARDKNTDPHREGEGRARHVSTRTIELRHSRSPSRSSPGHETQKSHREPAQLAVELFTRTSSVISPLSEIRTWTQPSH